MRLFVALRPSLAAATAIGESAAGLRRLADERGVAARWVPPAAYHVTLGYLGETRPEALEAIRDAIGAALVGAAPVSLAVGGLGGFPSRERAEVAWLGVGDPGGRLADLAQRVGRAAEGLGFPASGRPFSPHLTLARLDPPASLDGFASGAENLRSESLCSTVELFDSSGIAADSGYRELARWPLGGALKPVPRQT